MICPWIQLLIDRLRFFKIPRWNAFLLKKRSSGEVLPNSLCLFLPSSSTIPLWYSPAGFNLFEKGEILNCLIIFGIMYDSQFVCSRFHPLIIQLNSKMGKYPHYFKKRPSTFWNHVWFAICLFPICPCKLRIIHDSKSQDEIQPFESWFVLESNSLLID